MFSKISAAKAFLDAGNVARARAEIESVLKDDPHNAMALDVYCRILRETEQWDIIEPVAKDWLSRDGKAVPAYANLLLCYQRGAKRNDAKALKQLYERTLSAPSHLQMLNDLYEVCFGDRAGTWSRLSDEAAAFGDLRTSFDLASRVAMLRMDLPKAALEAEFALRAGDRSVDNLERLSVLSFRLMRLSAARRYARMALQADPARPLPREISGLSWLAYLPPFMLAGWLLYFFQRMSRIPNEWLLVAMFVIGPVVFVVLMAIIQAISWLFHLSTSLVAGMTVVYFIYVGFMLGTLSRMFGKHVRKTIKLEDY